MIRLLITAGVLCALALIIADCYLSYRHSRKATPYIVMSPTEIASAERAERCYQVAFEPDEIRCMLAMRRAYAKQHKSEVHHGE